MHARSGMNEQEALAEFEYFLADCDRQSLEWQWNEWNEWLAGEGDGMLVVVTSVLFPWGWSLLKRKKENKEQEEESYENNQEGEGLFITVQTNQMKKIISQGSEDTQA